MFKFKREKEQDYDMELFDEVEESELERILKDEVLKAELDKEAKIGAVGLLVGVVALPVVALAATTYNLIRKK